MFPFLPDVLISDPGRLALANRARRWFVRHWTARGRALARRLEAFRP